MSHDMICEKKARNYMDILEKIKDNPYLKDVLKNVNDTVSFRTLLIGLGNAGSTVIEQMKNQDAGIKNYCSADQKSLYEISDMLTDTDLAVLVCGFDTDMCVDKIGSIALRAKRLGVLTLGLFITPSESDGEEPIKEARETIKDIKGVADALVVIPKERIRSIPENEDLNHDELDTKTSKVLQTISKRIIQMISDMEVDDANFRDIRRVLNSKGIMYFGMGQAEGENKAALATAQAMNNYLAEGTLSGANSLILNVSGNISLTDSTDIMDIFEKEIGRDADVLYDLHVDKTAGDIIRVTVLAAA